MKDRRLTLNAKVMLLGIPVALLLALAGCSQEEAPKSTDEVKAFAGDPAKKAEANKADIAKAAQDAAAAHPTAMVATPGPPPATK